MDLTKSQKRELMWIASVCSEDGSVQSSDLEIRKSGMNSNQLDDFMYRYDALERMGYVDQLIHAWGEPVITVRVTEEGRERAEEFLEAELESSLISDDAKSTIRGAFINQGVAAGFKAFLLAVGFIS